MTVIGKEVEVKNQLRISLNGKWSNVDFINFFTALENIYELYIISDEVSQFKTSKNPASIMVYLEQLMGSDSTIIYEKNGLKVGQGRQEFRLKFLMNEQLSILKLKFASPGFADLGGFGAAIGHIKDVILRLIDSVENRKSRRLENDKKQIENDVLKIEKTKKIVELLRNLNYPESRIIKILEVENKSINILSKLVENMQIEDAE